MKKIFGIMLFFLLAMFYSKPVYAVEDCEKTIIIIQYKENTANNYVPRVLLQNNKCELVHKFITLRMESWQIDYADTNSIVEKLVEDPLLKLVQIDDEIIGVDQNDFKQDRNKTRSYLQSYYEYQWGIENKGQLIVENGIAGIDTSAVAAWNITKGSSNVLVGILDSGIDISNSNIVNSIYQNILEISDNGIDDDNNGYIDDVNGWDFYHKDNSVYDSFSEDSHGTYVSGIVTSSDDKQGIVGVAPNVEIIPLKFMDTVQGGSSSTAIEAIEYAQEIGVDILICSWNGTQYNAALYEAIKASNIVFVCSAGNSGKDVDENPVYPACYDLDNIIAVGAINNRGDISIISNTGQSVDVLAPGEDIISILPEENYIFASGTSSAVPFVAGAAALAKSVHPELSPADLIQAIKFTTDKEPIKYCNINSKGRVNAYRLLQSIIEE